MATLAELEQALINADAAGDADAARTLAAAVVEARKGPTPPEPSFAAKVGDVFTGNLRKTPETQSLPEWTTMPELNEFSAASAKSGLGTLLAPTAEIPQIIKAQYPGVGVRQDEKGNYILKSSKDGKEYAIPPGMTWGDLPRILGGLAAFTPAGRAATLPGMALAGGATQAVIEGTQAATGGEFNPGDVVAATVLPPAAALAARGAGAAAGALRRVITKPAQEASAADAGAIPSALPALPPTPVPAPAAAPVAPMPATQLARTTAKAAQGNTRAQQVLAGQAMPDAETVAAAERLGIADNLQPDHVTTNQAFRELAQAVKSIPGSEARAAELQGLEAVAKRADDLVTQIGGADDVADLGVRLKGSMLTTQKELEDMADDLYGQVRQQIPPSSPVKADNVLAFVKQRAEELGGVQNLSAMERRIVARLTPKASSTTETVAPSAEQFGLMLGAQPKKVVTQTIKQPTYALLDDVRRDVGAAARQQGPFKDADTGLAKRLYSAIANDQLAAAEAHGAADTYRAAQSAVRTRKALEDDIVAIFGKALDRSLSPALASSVGKLAAGDTQGLARLIEATPAHMRREVVASGIQYALTGGAKKQAVNFGSYARWYEGLRKNAPAYALIARNLDAQALKGLNDLYKVSKGISLATRERITTGRIQAVTEELKGVETLAGRIYQIAGVAAKGLAAEGVTTASGVPGAGMASVVTAALMKQKTDVMKAADALIASQAFMKLAAKYQATGKVDRGWVLKLIHSKEMKNFMRLLRDPGPLSDREQFVLAALQDSRQRENTSAMPALPAPRMPESRTVH